MPPKYGRIKISGFKSISDLEIKNLTPFTVLAGPNASGKSNIFDAIKFAGRVIELGASTAIKHAGGFKSIHCRKKRKESRKTFSFELDWYFKNPANEQEEKFFYTLKIVSLDTSPIIHEKLSIDKEVIFEREGTKLKKFKATGTPYNEDFIKQSLEAYAGDDNSLLQYVYLFSNKILWLTSKIKKFTFDPSASRETNKPETQDVELEFNGNNLAALLMRLEKEENNICENICEYIEYLVPGMHKVTIDNTPINGGAVLHFKEHSSKSGFPPGLISDGTIYILCLLTALFGPYTPNRGFMLIEEPERGIHPKAIEELTSLMKDQATWQHPIFITTHSETIVRTSSTKNLVLVTKESGLTKTIRPELPENIDIPLDEAWLSNMFGGGLPW